MKKLCLLEDRACTGCGRCNVCDLNPDKICDNCCLCIASEAEYRSVAIDEIIAENSGEEP